MESKVWLDNLKNEVKNIQTYSMQDRFFLATEEALEVYNSYGMDKNNFEDWFINSFYAEGQKTVRELYAEENNSMIKDSYFSIFKVTEKGEKVVLKDIFTKDDYPVNTNEEFGNELITARVYKTDKGYGIVDQCFDILGALETRIVQIVFEQYNHYCVEFGNIDINQFIQLNQLFIMKVQDIVLESEDKVSADDMDYTAYQSKYVISDSEKSVTDIMLKHPAIEKNQDYPNVYAIMDNSVIIAEIEVESKELYIITNDSETLQACKELIESIIGDQLTFVSDYEVSLDDLL